MQSEDVKRETYYQDAPSASINSTAASSGDKVQDIIASKKAKLLGNVSSSSSDDQPKRRKQQVEDDVEDLEGESPDSENSSPTSKKMYTFKSKQ